jgi:hypothetical protein
MEEFIINGLVHLIPYDSFSLKEGIKGIINVDDKKVIITVNHLNISSGNWVCTDKHGEIYISDIILNPVLTYSNLNYEFNIDIQKKDWQYLINKNLENTVKTCTVTPYKFNYGTYTIECNLCYGYFTAAPSQKICEQCCGEKATAKLHRNTAPNIIKKKGAYTHIEMRQIAEWAFSLSKRVEDLNINDLIEKYLEDNNGNNSN